MSDERICSIKDRLVAIARRIETNLPSRHDPEQFHAEKSALADDLRRIARSLDNK